jgi:hypothetical protein
MRAYNGNLGARVKGRPSTRDKEVGHLHNMHVSLLQPIAQTRMSLYGSRSYLFMQSIAHVQELQIKEEMRQGELDDVMSGRFEYPYSRIPYSLILYWRDRKLIPSSLAAFSRWLVTSTSVRRITSFSISSRVFPRVTTMVRTSSWLA